MTIKRSTLFAVGLYAVLAAGAAVAQIATGNEFATQTPGKSVVGAVQMCVGADSRAYPCPSGAGSAPSAATQIQGNGSGTTGAVVGTLAGAAAKTTYLCDFDVSAIGGTATVGPVVVAGLLGGSKTYQLSSSASGTTLSKSFSPCLPASAVNSSITVTTTANGTATAVNVNSSGFQQ